MRWTYVLLLCACTGIAGAREKPIVLMLDASASTVSGARGRLGFERLPVGKERMAWVDPTGHWDSAALAIAAGGGLLGAGLGDGLAQEQRNATLAPLRKVVERDGRLQNTIASSLRTSASAQGYPISETFVASSMAEGYMRRALPRDGMAVMARMDKAAPMVMLSWDDRQPLLAVDLRRIEKIDGVRMPFREKAARTVRYVGYPASSAENAVSYWAEDDGRRFMAEVESGLAAMLPVFWNADIDHARASRSDVVRLRIGDREFDFPGRLWRQDGPLAYLSNRDGGITIVRTEPLGSD